MKKSKRIESIDLLRGLVMLVMALDHVRDYFHADSFTMDPTDLSHDQPLFFLTRWITHFCAPVFMFLAGTSAYQVGLKLDKHSLFKWLFTRGVWLIFIEWTVVQFAWFFTIQPVFLCQVIWAIGVAMIVLSILIYLPYRAILAIGLVLVLGHNALDNYHVTDGSTWATVWTFLHDRGPAIVFGKTFYVAYPILPWIGVIALGYCFGALYQPDFPAGRRKKWLRRMGWTSIVAFLILRIFNIYGESKGWGGFDNPLLNGLSILNTTKYPPSLDYLLMTLGPSFLFLSHEHNHYRGWWQKVITVGRVPMFYYILHLYVIHLAAMLAAQLTGYGYKAMILNGWMSSTSSLDGYGFSLFGTYLVWIAVVLILFPICSKYEKYKRANPDKKWLKYL